jgi:hypothetical protein
VLGEGKIDARVDIYALTMVLGECLLGFAPYAKMPPAELLDCLREGKALDFRKLLPKAPEAVLRILERGTAPERDWRFRNAAEFLAALDEAVRETGWSAGPRDLKAALRGLVPGRRLFRRVRAFVRRWAIPAAVVAAIALGWLLLRRPF